MSRSNKGFTLIELLVVIAIIAILAAILFPVFARAKESAGKAACLNNLKQLGSAQLLYRDAYSDRLPINVSYLGKESGWGCQGDFSAYYILLAKYTKTKGGSFVCPQMYPKKPRMGADGEPDAGPGHYHCTAKALSECPGTTSQKQTFFKDRYGYIYNGDPYQTTSYAALAYPRDPRPAKSAWDCFLASKYRYQSKTLYLVEFTQDLIFGVPDVQYPRDKDPQGKLAPRHDGATDVAVLYYDGHCGVLNKTRFVEEAWFLLGGPDEKL